MDINILDILINPQNTNWLTKYQSLLGVLLTIGAMFFINHQNKNRWLKDGYLKRKVDLELEIRRYLLNIEGYCLSELKIEEVKNLLTKDLSKDDLDFILEFNKNYEWLCRHLSDMEKNRDTSHRGTDTRILTLMSEYCVFNEKIEEKLKKFSAILGILNGLRTIYKNGDSETPANKMYPAMLFDEIAKSPERLEEMLKVYINLCSVISEIVNELEKSFPKK